MTVCARRPEECGFFTSCKPCECGAEVREALATALLAAEGEVGSECHRETERGSGVEAGPRSAA